MASRKSKSSEPTLEQQIDELVARESVGYVGRAARDIPPSRVPWAVGDDAKLGSLDKATVVRLVDDGRRLVLLTEHTSERRGLETRLVIEPWFDVRKADLTQPTAFARPESLQLNYQQSTVADLLGKRFHMGMEDAPAYQRDLVWTMEQKQELIESMFDHVDLGKFVLIDLEYKENRATFEILDGKQRLNALVGFVSDEFDHHGVKFSQMSRSDRYFFQEYPVSLARVPEKSLTWEQRLNLFLRLNTTGTPQSTEHLALVRRLRDQARETRLLQEAARAEPATKPSVPR